MSSSIFYFLYFAAFGIYVPYWTLYLRSLEFTPLQIASVYAIPSAVRIVLPPLYGYIADRWKARRSFLIISCAGQILPLALILFFHSYTTILILMTVFSFLNATVLSFTEATVQEEQEKGRLDYGRTRLWGTVGFILLAGTFGLVLDAHSADWTLYGFIFFLFLLSAASFAMPEGKMQFELKHEHLRDALILPATRIFFLCAFLMYLSHGAFYGFFSIYLADLGYTDSRIGLQWAVAAASELSVFYFGSQILQRSGSRKLLSLCCLAASVRWVLTGASTSFWILIAVQCLHAFTFGLFHITSMRLIHRLFPEGSRSFGQALYTSSGMGLGGVIGLLLSGRMWEQLGGSTFYISGAVMMIAFVISLWLIDPSKKETSETA